VQDDGTAVIKDFQGSVRNMANGVDSSSKKVQGAFTSLREQINTTFSFSAGALLAKSLESGTQAIRQFASDSVSAFREFETVMTGVAKTTGLPKTEIAALSTQLRNVAAEIGPIMATDIGKIAEVAGQLGIASDSIKVGNFAAARKEITAFSTTIGKAAIALPEFSGGAEQVATVIAKQIGLYQADTAAAEQYLSVMNELANTTAANAQQIAGFLEGFTMAPQLKITQAAASALGATFISLGQDAHDSATRFQAALTQVTKGYEGKIGDFKVMFEGNAQALEQLAQITGQTLAEFEAANAKYGESAQKNAEKFADYWTKAFSQDAIGATTVLLDELGKIDNSVALINTSTKMFGRVGARAMNALIGNTGKLTTSLETANSAAQAATSIQTEFGVAVSTQGAKFEELKSKVAEVKIEVGQHLTGALAAVIATDLNPLVDQFRNWLTTSKEAQNFFQVTLPGAINITSTAIQGIATAGTTVYQFIQTSSTAVGTLIGDLQTGQTSLNEIVGAAGKAFGLTTEQSSVAAETISGSLATIKGYWDALPATIAALSSPWETLKLAGGEAWEVIKDKAATALDSIRPAIALGTSVKNAIAAAGTSIGTTIDGVDERIENLMTGFRNLQTNITAVIDAIVAKIKTVPEAFNDAVEAVKNFGEAAQQSVFQNEKAVGFFQKLTDKIYGVEDALEGHSLTPAIYNYVEAAAAGGAATTEFSATLTENAASVQSAAAQFVAFADQMSSIGGNLGTMGGGLGKLGDLFGIKELGGIGDVLGQMQEYAQIPKILSDIGGAASGLLGNLGGLLGGGGLGGLGSAISGLLGGGGLGGLGSALGSLSGAFGGLGSAIGGLLPALGPIGLAGGAIALAWNPLKDLFSDIFGGVSEGTKAARAWQDFVGSAVSGGAELQGALSQQRDAFSQAGNDMVSYSNQFGEAWDALVFRFTDNSAMTALSDAIGQATGNMEKAPQVAMQTVGAMLQMGMSIDQVALQMGSMIAASAGTNVQLEQQRVIEDMLANSSGLTAAQIEALNSALAGLQGSDAGLQSAANSANELGNAASNASGNVSNLGMSESLAAMQGQTLANSITQAGTAATASAAAMTNFGSIAISAGSVGTASAQAVAGSMVETANQITTTTGEATTLKETVNALPKEKTITIKIEVEGEIPELASGGLIGGGVGLALVGDKYGPEIARFPSGRSAFVGLAGPEVLPFPGGTQIIPNRQIGAYLRSQPVPAMAEGGIVEPMLLGRNIVPRTRQLVDLLYEANQAASGLSGHIDTLDRLSEGAQWAYEDLLAVQTISENIGSFGYRGGMRIPWMASGGLIGDGVGLALVGDRYGPEIARFPSGRSAFVGLAGPEVLPFPGGTQIIPNRQIGAYLRAHPVPAMAAGGTVHAMPAGNIVVHIDKLVVQGQMGNGVDIQRMADELGTKIAQRVNEKVRRRSG
jgi:TP901 family phage tail tape measure protein